MLRLLVSGIDPIPDRAIMDAERAFAMTTLTGSSVDKELISNIEQGTYLSPHFFLDRFGAKLSTVYMSTGCKIALTVCHRPELCVNGVEAGVNALSALIKNCRDGTLIIANEPFAFCTVGAGPIDVLYRGYRYTSFDRFADYMYNEWPEKPQIFEGDEGVTCSAVS